MIGDLTRQSLAMEVDMSLSGELVTRVLDGLIKRTGKPEALVLDNGPEFASRAMLLWAEERGVALNYIEPRKPVQNAFVVSFNGRVRDECLNPQWFRSLRDARIHVAIRQEDYNSVRPHSILDYLAPDVFTAR